MRRTSNKSKNPRMSWDSDEIKARKELMSSYGLRKRREILSAHEVMRKFRRRARELIAEREPEKKQILLGKLENLGLLEKDQDLEDILALTVNDILERRLQTIVWKKGFANTARHARQMITHGHVSIEGKRVKFPAYIVKMGEESKIKTDAPQVAAEGEKK